jgi:hypothetical protein
MLELASNLDSLVEHTQIHIPDYPDDGVTSGWDSISGKLKSICSTLFFSLTSLEKDLLDSSPLLNSFSASLSLEETPLENPQNPFPLTLPPASQTSLLDLFYLFHQPILIYNPSLPLTTYLVFLRLFP